MRLSRRPPSWKGLETWLWTGPLGHLLGGTLDLGAALLRHGLRRARRGGRARLRRRVRVRR
jgi:hypothetical protein